MSYVTDARTLHHAAWLEGSQIAAILGRATVGVQLGKITKVRHSVLELMQELERVRTCLVSARSQ